MCKSWRFYLQLIGAFGSEEHSAGVSLVTLAAQNHKGIIVAIERPRARRDFAKLDKPPVANVLIAQPEIVANARRHVQSGALIQVGSWPLVAENVLPMIGAKWATILPLGEADSVSMTDRDPAALENSLAIADKRRFKPGYNMRSFWFGMAAFDVIIRQCNVKRILPRNKIDRNVISAS